MSMSVGSTAPELERAPAPAGSAAPAARPSPLDQETFGERPLDARRVLVVEPDAGPRGLLQLGLIREGFQVAALASAEEAERQLAEGLVLPGLVVAEVGLGGADGIALCQRLRAHPRLRDVPVLLLAAHPTPGEMEAAGRAGADDYLPKPLFVADLVSLVRLRAGRPARDATLESSTDVLPLASVLRALLTGSSSGRLLLEPGGQLLFRRGEVVSVRFEGVEGERGLTRMLCLGRGSYRIHLGPVLARGEVSIGVRDLCGRLGSELLLWERLVAVSVPLDAVLQPDFEALRTELPALPREAEALLRLFDGKRTVREVILASALSETATLKTASRLYALGILLPEVLARAALRAPYLPTGWESLVQAPAAEAAWMRELRPPEPSAPEAEGEVEAPVQAPRTFKPPSAPAEPPELHQPEASPLEAAALTLARVYQPSQPESEAVPEDAWDDDLFQAGLRRRRRWLLAVGLVAAVALVVGSLLAFRGGGTPAPAPAAGEAQAAGEPEPRAPEPSTPASVPAEPRPPEPGPTASAPPEAAPGGAEPSAPAGHTLAEGIALYRAALPSAAVRVLDEVVQQTPDAPLAWLYLALARFDAGDVRGAEGAAMKAVALDPKEPRVHLLLAGIHLGRGERARANAELQRVLALEPEGPEADDARRLLGSLRDVR